MAPARETGHPREHPPGREQETRPAFPPPERDSAPQTGGSRHHERPAPAPAGEKRPPGAGRALAGGFGPPAGPDPGVTLWQGRWPLPERPDIRENARPGGNGKRDPRFPAPAGRRPVDWQVQDQQRPAPDPAGAKRPPEAGRALAGGFGPRLGKDQPAAAAGAMAPARMRKARAGRRVSRFSVGQPLRPTRRQHPVRSWSETPRAAARCG